MAVQPYASQTKKMLSGAIKYLLFLNWGYKLGLWTYQIKKTRNGIAVEKSTDRLHSFISILIGIFLNLNHLSVVLALLVYEWIKPYKNIPETALVIGTGILMADVSMIVTFRLLQMDFLVMLLRNTYKLGDVYARYYKWDPNEKSGIEVYFKIMSIASAIFFLSILPCGITMVALFDFQPALFYYSIFFKITGKYYAYLVIPTICYVQIIAIADFLLIFQLMQILPFYIIMKSGMLSSIKAFDSLDSSDPERLRILLHYRTSELFFHKLAFEMRAWVLAALSFASVSMIYQIFCTLFCPRECGFFPTMIAMISFLLELGVIRIVTEIGTKLQETSVSTIEAFNSRTLKPVELKMVKSMTTLALPIGHFSTIDRETLPFIMSDVIIDNSVGLLLSF